MSVIGPFIANEVGWATAEVGRQPWIVHPNVVRDAAGNIAFDAAGMIQYQLSEGLLTRNAVSESIKGSHVLASIIMFSFIYFLLFWVWLYVLNDKIQKGPETSRRFWATSTRDGCRPRQRATLHEESMSEAKDPSRNGGA